MLIPLSLIIYWNLEPNSKMVTDTCFRVRELKSIKEIEESFAAYYIQWGAGLNVEQFLQRQHLLQNCYDPDEVEMTYWYYEKLDTSTGEWEMVSTLKVLIRSALYKIKGQPVKQTINRGITNVFTPEKHRGQGYAKTLIDLVVKQTDANIPASSYIETTEESEKYSFSSLFSDIGNYYSKCGFSGLNSDEIQIKVPKTPIELPKSSSGLKFLTKEDFPVIFEKQKQILYTLIDTLTEKDGFTRIAVTPTAGIYRMLYKRPEFYFPILFPETCKDSGSSLPLFEFGASLNNLYMLWTQDFSHKTFTIFALGPINPNEPFTLEDFLQDLVPLLCVALKEAQRWKLPVVNIWPDDLPYLTSSLVQVTMQEVLDAWNSSPDNLGLNAAVRLRADCRAMWRRWGHQESKDVEWAFAGRPTWF